MNAASMNALEASALPKHPTQNLILNFARFHTTVVGTFGHIESTIV
jgi:hypothetical protein